MILINWVNDKGESCRSIGWVIEEDELSITLIADLDDIDDDTCRGNRARKVLRQHMVDITQLIVVAEHKKVVH